MLPHGTPQAPQAPQAPSCPNLLGLHFKTVCTDHDIIYPARGVRYSQSDFIIKPYTIHRRHYLLTTVYFAF